MSPKIVNQPVTLAPLPKLPKSARKPKPEHPCECGCGTITRAPRFVPGHDSRLRGWILRVERGVVELSAIPDGERQAVELAMGKAVTPTRKQTQAERKAARKAAKAQVKAQPESTVVEPPSVAADSLAS